LRRPSRAGAAYAGTDAPQALPIDAGARGGRADASGGDIFGTLKDERAQARDRPGGWADA